MYLLFNISNLFALIFSIIFGLLFHLSTSLCHVIFGSDSAVMIIFRELVLSDSLFQ